jgi:glycosyltransferase involved in cell wall biosynthesis
VRLAIIETNPHGGLLHYATQLADALARRGHDVDLLVPRGNELLGRPSAANVRPVLTPHVRSTAPSPRGFRYHTNRVAVGARLTRAYVRAAWNVVRGGYDAVVIEWELWFPLAELITRAMCRAPGHPVVAYIAHNPRPFNRWGGDGLYLEDALRARLTRVYRDFDLVLVHGEHSERAFRELWPPVPIAAVPHGDEGVFVDDPPPPAGEPRILFFGDWRKVKGLDVLMDAYDALVRRRPEVSLLVAGTPAPVDYDDRIVRRFAARHPGRVELVDRYVPIEEVRDVFARARVVATPYVAGSQSGVLHLAKTMARPVVTSDVGDLPSAVTDGVSGFVVPAGDAAALADALERVVTDAELAARMGDAARREVTTHSSWDVVAAGVEAALAAAVERRRAPARA